MLARLQYPPHRGIGRTCKVDRTQIVGLITALKLYVSQDEEEEFQRWDMKVKRLMDLLSDVPNIKHMERIVRHASPYVKLTIDEESLGLTAKEVHRLLMKGDPRIMLGPENWDMKDVIQICVRELSDEEENIVVERLKETLSK